ncbi:MAG: shikimate dehydrogenase [Sphaerochaetaceae bacterium]|jgi:3-dehydroquinate dehydratase/shikimate dehydrogenase
MICLVLAARSIEENRSIYERNKSFCEIVELRIDTLDEQELPKAKQFPLIIDHPVILTCRRQIDGGSFTKSEKERLALLEELLDSSFSYIDIEEDVRKNSLEAKALSTKTRIIRSFHDFKSIPTDIYHKIAKMASGGAIPKVAVQVNSTSDLITLFRVKDELQHIKEKIVVGMGDYGLPTRILYKKMGSLLTYCSEEQVAPGHIPAQTMKELYRADMVNDSTRIFGVIGNPVLHSKSPHIHNRGFHEIAFNAIYLPFVVDQVRSFFTLAEMLQITGFSVTVPHKQDVLPYLGTISREVKQIGSCNTVVRKRNLWSGLNTDYYGFIQPLMEQLDHHTLKEALVIGAGGAARAVVWALRNHGCKVIIVNRNVERAKKLAQETMASYDSLQNAHNYEGVQLVVQTTSVGMEQEGQSDPIPQYNFSKDQLVYELIYRPKFTPLLQRAQKQGCTLLFGIEMLLRQGMLQFEAFTGYHYPKNLQLEEN